MAVSKSDPQSQQAPPPASFDDDQVVLNKNGQRYAFQCAPGTESELLARLPEIGADPSNDLDWFDAAVISHQIGQRLKQSLDRRSAGELRQAS